MSSFTSIPQNFAQQLTSRKMFSNLQPHTFFQISLDVVDRLLTRSITIISIEYSLGDGLFCSTPFIEFRRLRHVMFIHMIDVKCS